MRTRYKIQWTSHAKVHKDALEAGWAKGKSYWDFVQPEQYSEYEFFPTLREARGRAKQIISKRLDSFGAVSVVKQEEIKHRNGRREWSQDDLTWREIS